MDNVNYERWADFYAEMLAVNGVGVGGKVCECACGTGGLTIPLVCRGFQMTGVDLSQEMLWIAAQKARKMGVGLPFVQQDMRKLHLHRQMDAVIATCDGVNYLLTEEDVCAFFRAAYDTMRPGGVLIYSTCTIGLDENQLNLQWFLKYFPFRLESIDSFICDELKSKTTKGGYLQLLPGIHDCDGFFIARLRKNEDAFIPEVTPDNDREDEDV
jgi:2-polyprenyl-3-methyl-5-hydroxy-6-metoxy-1,4-benzoquinol methylase